MRTYLIVTSVIFGLITVAHIWRVVVENPHLAVEPWFILLTAVSASLCVWGLRLLGRSSKS